MEGWWLNKEVYDLTHSHPDFKPRFEKYRSLFENVLMGQTYFRVEKKMPGF
jgi:hypothetical protein